MSSAINFISGETEKRLKLAKLIRQLTRLVGFLAAIFVVLNVSLLVLSLLVRANYGRQQKEKKGLESQIKQLDKVESYLYTISERGRVVDGLRQGQASYAEYLKQLNRLIIPGFSFGRFDQVTPCGELMITGLAVNSRVLAAFESHLNSLVREGYFTELKARKVERDSGGRYSVTLSLIAGCADEQ